MPLRLRLALFGAAVVALALLVFGLLLYGLLSRGVATNQDDALRTRAQQAVRSLDASPQFGAAPPVAPADLKSTTDVFLEVFDLSWAVDDQGHPVRLDHADFVRITHALDAVHPVFGRSSTQVDAVSLVRPAAR